ncbi:FtsW/RodA/SpoVE family cell cycle protein [Candidatus Saccharibacteria bacterium]|nr:FtsW/RodA/SpoVE family cell cycle protein [Candidatus Saccharibacteria bacterium]
MIAKRTKVKLSSHHRPDVPFIIGALALLAFGVLMVYDSSAVSAVGLLGGQYHYLILQLIWVGLGVAGALFFYFLDYHKLKKVAFPLFLVTVVLLVLVLLPTSISYVIRGSRSWLVLPLRLPLIEGFSIQPSELSKLALILYLAALFTNQGRGRSKEKEGGPKFLFFAVPTALIAALILLEPDLGTAAIIVALGFAAFFFAEGALWKILLTLPAVLAAGVGFILLNPSRLGRIRAFLDPSSDPLGVAYHVNQILIALGSGGLLGLGIGESRQKYGYIPDVSTDAIFAVVGEEFGFLGTFFVVALLGFILYRGFLIAKHAPDGFGRVLAASISSWVGLQALVNLGAVTNILPLTGVPLPLISYGGSSLVVLLSSFGILLNISRQTVRSRK